MSEFKEFTKIHRYSRDVVVTEKLDGTNGLVEIGEDGSIRVGSRTRYITPQDDNYGFAAWVEANKDELLKLGTGRHHGEWWGQGIQRKYGMAEKRFSLFNTHKWSDDSVRPACCSVVPLLWSGLMDDLNVPQLMAELLENGSKASPGFMKPEGIVIYHTQGNFLLKKTFEKDDHGKNYGA